MWLVVNDEYALGHGARLSHVLNLSGPSASRQPAKGHDSMTELSHPLFVGIVPGLGFVRGNHERRSSEFVLIAHDLEFSIALDEGAE